MLFCVGQTKLPQTQKAVPFHTFHKAMILVCFHSFVERPFTLTFLKQEILSQAK